MKKAIFTIAFAICGAVSTNAQVVIYTNNLADSVEYDRALYGAVAAANQQAESTGRQCYEVLIPVGNNAEYLAPAWSARWDGLGLEMGAKYLNFDKKSYYGFGFGATYQRKFGMVYADFGLVFDADEAPTSEHYGKKFLQIHGNVGIATPPLIEARFKLAENCCSSVLQFRLYGQIGVKKCKDYKTDRSVNVIETEDEYILQYQNGNLDAKPHTVQWEIGERGQLSIGGTPLYLFEKAGWGKGQYFTYSEKQWRNQFNIQVGIGFIINNGHGYTKALKGSKNTYLYEDYGWTREEVKKHNW